MGRPGLDSSAIAGGQARSGRQGLGARLASVEVPRSHAPAGAARSGAEKGSRMDVDLRRTRFGPDCRRTANRPPTRTVSSGAGVGSRAAAKPRGSALAVRARGERVDEPTERDGRGKHRQLPDNSSGESGFALEQATQPAAIAAPP